MSTPLDLVNQQIDNGLFVQASAGTGKTFSIAALIVREIGLAGEPDPATGRTRPDITISEILVTTFTRNAAAELRDRVRRRLVDTASALASGSNPDKDPIVALLADGPADRVAARRSRIMRAVVEFDTATISTIHSVCSKVIALAGESTEMDDEDVESRIVDEVVNDVMLSRRAHDHVLDTARFTSIVRRIVSEPLTVAWHDPSDPDTDGDLADLASAVDLAVARVRLRLAQTPSFSWLVNRARDIMSDGQRHAVRAEFRRRYRCIIVDEAQDTDAQQWDLFRAIFPVDGDGHGGALLAVGDPKQSIYKFRGADVDAYTIERDRGSTVTLQTNHRSDKDVVQGLNELFDGMTFGSGITYERVKWADGHETAGTSIPHAVEIIRAEKVTNNVGVANTAARRVLEILGSGATINVAGPNGTVVPRALRPSDIVVLVSSGAVGYAVERALKNAGVPAVSNGTASVMRSESAEHWRVLLSALERVSHAGRVRHLLGTPLFGVDLRSPALLDDDFIGSAQDRLFDMLQILRSDGIAALSAHILSDPSTVIAMSRSEMGERRLTDFSHVSDLLHTETDGRGCSPSEALERFNSLLAVDPTSETVSRRVESDSAAVQIMTIHVSKGLEFPVVVVADQWEAKDRFGGDSVPVVRLEPGDDAGIIGRVADIGWGVGRTSALAVSRMDRDFRDDKARLFYVAATRARHHVSIVWSNPKSGCLLDGFIPDGVKTDANPHVNVRRAESITVNGRWQGADETEPTDVDVADGARPVAQTYARTSFTGILSAQSGRHSVGGSDHVSGTEEGARLFGRRARYAATDVPFGVPSMPLARVPGGTHIGTIVHEVYEKVDPAHPDLHDHVRQVVFGRIAGRLRDEHGARIAEGIALSLQTPLGGAFGDITLAGLGRTDRAAELGFEMSMADMTAGIRVRDIGRIMAVLLPGNDLLAPYSHLLDDRTFDLPLGGLINGSIDALLRLVGPDGTPRLVVSDYKSNRLDAEGDSTLMAAYTQERMLAEMVHHHYPLQAVIYGTAVYRMLRARAPHLDPDSSVSGFAYLFVRAMVGVDTPVDAHGNRNGVLTWTAPAGFWSRMSDFFAGDRP